MDHGYDPEGRWVQQKQLELQLFFLYISEGCEEGRKEGGVAETEGKLCLT